VKLEALQCNVQCIQEEKCRVHVDQKKNRALIVYILSEYADILGKIVQIV